MKPITPELRALLDSGRYVQGDLYTLTLPGGQIMRKTSLSGLAVTWDGQVFAFDGLHIERGTITSKLHKGNLDVDNVDITLRYTPSETWGGLPVPHFIRNGGLDGARLLIQKFFCARDASGNTNPVATGVIFLFEGKVSGPKPGRMQTTLTLVADTGLLSVNVPRETINLNCMNTHYDTHCGLLEADFTHASTVVTATKLALTTTMPQPDTYFAQGRVVFTSGANNGAVRTIKKFTGGVLVLAYPLDFTPQAGDTFNAVAGCDLSEPTCDGRFDNLPNRRCFKFVPPYEENL